eukprot:CAMPEP_0182875226 /NCGR_PEP_ID=MMETSP0034_2-20130328/13418_1 /TAXON_ID=156128 /ORGANISM="Nephroselmis pyriformis, Strain CCMP717" /LENGTH=58 /DNA_ID=CAMNT_0025007959 /DNA_START=38 /DNA_END=211 /DNA_ORIENTATION=+
MARWADEATSCCSRSRDSSSRPISSESSPRSIPSRSKPLSAHPHTRSTCRWAASSFAS